MLKPPTQNLMKPKKYKDKPEEWNLNWPSLDSLELWDIKYWDCLAWSWDCSLALPPDEQLNWSCEPIFDDIDEGDIIFWWLTSNTIATTKAPSKWPSKTCAKRKPKVSGWDCSWGHLWAFTRCQTGASDKNSQLDLYRRWWVRSLWVHWCSDELT